MKILLIQSSRLKDDGTVYRHRFRWLMGLTLPYLAALCGREHQVTLVDDCLQEIPYGEPFDLVCLTFMSHQATRAYQIAARFRDRRVPVAMGGFHVSLGAPEVQEHCDALVAGEAETGFPALLEDLSRGKLQKVYRGNALHDLRGLPVPRYDLMKTSRYKIPNLPVQTTRGCPWNCNYCEVTQVYGRKYRFRPAEEVLEEIRAAIRMTKRKLIYFVDDNFTANRDRAMALMEQIPATGARWTALCTMSVGDDPELLRAIKKTGGLHLNIGMETINPDSLVSIDKKQNRIKDYERQIRAIRDAGLDFSVNVMFGLDGDTPQVIRQTTDFLIENKVPSTYIFILAPRVGTRVRESLLLEGRIFDHDWRKYCGYETVFHPKNMTVEELNRLFWEAHRRFYSPRSIYRRLLSPKVEYLNQALPLNIAFAWGSLIKRHPLSFY